MIRRIMISAVVAMMAAPLSAHAQSAPSGVIGFIFGEDTAEKAEALRRWSQSGDETFGLPGLPADAPRAPVDDGRIRTTLEREIELSRRSPPVSYGSVMNGARDRARTGSGVTPTEMALAYEGIRARSDDAGAPVDPYRIPGVTEDEEIDALVGEEGYIIGDGYDPDARLDRMATDMRRETPPTRPRYEDLTPPSVGDVPAREEYGRWTRNGDTLVFVEPGTAPAQTPQAEPRRTPYEARYEEAQREEVEEIYDTYGSVPGGVVLETTDLPDIAIEKVLFHEGRGEFMLLPSETVYRSPLPFADAMQILEAVSRDVRVGVSIASTDYIVYGDLPASAKATRTLLAFDQIGGTAALGREDLTKRLLKPLAAMDTSAPVSGPQPGLVFFRFEHPGFDVVDDVLEPRPVTMAVSFAAVDRTKRAEDGGLVPQFVEEAQSRYEQNILNAKAFTSGLPSLETEPAVADTLALAEFASFARLLEDKNIDPQSVVVMREH
ncbi:hypothetical protein VQ042_21820 [Aurantimonas sp. A2-1-M11]|uniref:hypothetical protein n=1 Tax=Aurantimonas sp. A2-1-M11 TaxID=3113712 RepID=UPI002F95BF94